MVTAFVRTILLYFIIMLGLRLMGKRQIGELEPTELVLTMLAEASTRDISRAEKPEAFEESKRVARRGGNVAKVAREALEAETGQPVITSQNAAQLNAVVTELIEAVASEDEEK